MNYQLLNQNLYPADYRKNDIDQITKHLSTFQPLTLIGLPRVGLSRILRFLLVHPKLLSDQLKSNKILLLEIDINDLFELSEKNLWQLVLKRISDNSVSKTINKLYLSAVKTNDAFTFFNNTKLAVEYLCSRSFFVFFLFSRFDRCFPLFTYLFFSHIQSIKDIAKQKINFLFTSNRPLEYLCPEVFKGGNLEVFSQKYYIKPASSKDLLPVLQEFEKSRKIILRKEIKRLVCQYSGGHAQYALLILQTLENNNFNLNKISSFLRSDLDILQQGKEIWDYLNIEEKTIFVFKKKVPSDHFLSQIGLITPEEKVFNLLFENYIKTQGVIDKNSELTSKEKALYSILSAKKGELVIREELINFIWQDKAGEVNDWTLDQLVKRLRKKLSLQKHPHRLTTVKNQGYKFI